jgi:hypothetical protein
MAAWGGEDIDAGVLDDGLAEALGMEIGDLNGAEYHLSAVAWHAHCLLYFTLHYDIFAEFDDRDKRGGF